MRPLASVTTLTVLLALQLPAGLDAQEGAGEPGPGALDADTVEAGRFDFGKMWTFEYPPTDWFQEAYGFEATPDWFERARLSALRIPGCSASFVSPAGLVVTNHHCVRGAVSRVSRSGEGLLDHGFYAETLEGERPIPDYYADQLLAVGDVSDEVFAAMDGVPEDERAAARDAALDRIRARLTDEHGGDRPVRVEIVPLYNGGRWSSYVFRRFTDVRLVAAVELQAGFFGGDPDNFTYPRYALDFAFLRVYDEDGEPYGPEHWFTWGEGVEPGDAVFVIGNPGPTNRLKTVAQLEYQRDVYVPVRKRFFETRLQALREAYAADPVRGEELDLRNRAFSLSNSLKAYTGRLAALEDPYIMARKEDAEADLLDALAADPTLSEEFGDLVARMAAIQAEKRAMAGEEGAFYLLGHSTYGSRTLLRALLAARIEAAREAGVPADSLADAVADLREIEDHPSGLEEDYLALRLEDLLRWLADDPLVREALDGREPRAAARDILSTSVLATREATTAALGSEAGIPHGDPALELARTLLPRLGRFARSAAALDEPESLLAADLGRARFEVYGTEVAPDATSSPRITDGVVKGYEYNGTVAPPYTTLFGMYDHWASYRGVLPDWELPERWVPVPDGLDLSTPLNFVSTADTYGGNSGSPAITRELAIVGLNFDRNIEGLSRDFIYLPERGRNVMVDVRAIREALDVAYDADRIVHEILTGEMVRSEAEADALRR